MSAPAINLLRLEPNPRRGAIEELRTAFQLCYRIANQRERWALLKFEESLREVERAAAIAEAD